MPNGIHLSLASPARHSETPKIAVQLCAPTAQENPHRKKKLSRKFAKYSPG
jgi:hypothetical protein